jgi:hypothetical protein
VSCSTVRTLTEDLTQVNILLGLCGVAMRAEWANVFQMLQR